MVDDIKTNQLVAKAMLEQAGHVTVLADDGAAALAHLDDAEFDLVIMDIQMPVMSGDEAIERIRKSSTRYKQIPIIAVTANATRGEGERLLRLGATAHATKPIDIDEIHAQTRQLDRQQSA